MVTLVGCLVLVGWMFDIPSLKSLLSNSVTMKANTAIAFLLSGMSLWLLQNKSTGRGRRLIGQALAVIVTMLGLLTLSQYLFHWNLGIDQLVFREMPKAVWTSHPGRMAPTTALNFILIGFALLLLGQRTHRGYYPVQFLSLTATLFSWQPLLGYAYGFESLYGIASYTRMALLTVLAFIVLCTGILLACPDQGLMRVVTSNSLGGFIARRLLLAAITIPFVGGYLIIQGYQAGLYTIDFGLSLLIIGSIVIFAIWIWQNAQTLDRLDTQRSLTEQALQETNQTLQALVQASPLAIISLDTEANLKMWSPAAQTIFGWTEQEVLGHPLPFIPGGKQEEAQRLHQFKLQGNSVKGLELRRHKKDGSPIDIAVWGAPLQDSQGNISSTMAIIADITERKRTEEALRSSEERFRQLAENIQDVFWIGDVAQPQLIYVSPAYEQVWGQSCESLLASRMGWLDSIHPEDRDRTEAAFFEKVQRGEFDEEYRIVRPDGSVRWIRDRGFPIKNELGEVHRVAGIAEDITERKQAIDEAARSAAAIASLNQDLQRRVSELQTLFEVIPISIAITQDAECRHIQVNSTFAKILKIPLDANASCTPPSGAPQPTYQVCRDGIELPGNEQPLQYAAAHSTEVRDAEIDIVREDGAVFNLYGYAAPLFDEQGKARGAVSAFLDITERKRTEAALRESEERFRKFFEEAPIGICVVELNGRFLEVNKTYCQMLGYLEHELHQLTFAAITHPEDAGIDLGYAQQLFKGEIPSYQIEKRYIKKNGEIVWVNLTATMISEQDGKVCYGLGMVEDISDRKRTQEALQDTNQTLQALIQACPLAITVFNLDNGLVKMWNPAAEAIFGWSEQEVLGRFLPSVPEDKQHEFLANLDSIRRGETLTGLETRRQKKGDVPIDISVWAAPLRDAQGNVNCLSIVADISDRKRLEAERAQLLVREQAARTEAEAANRMKDEFLATLSHELRTPLNAMLGWTQMLCTRKFNQATTARALETIDRNTKSLAALIEDILDVSRIIRGKLHLNIRPVELTSIVEAAIETVRPAATLKEIQIDSLLDRSVGVVLGDGNRLQQVVWNLLSNAVKFTPKGGRVEVRLEQGTEVGSNVPSYVQIQVSDTGKGILRDFLPYVFDRFRQENSSTTRSYGGLGLGLAIVRHLVESHGGTVSADSPGEGQGATFSVQLPLVSALTEANERSLLDSTVEDKVPVERLSVLDGLRVLVVDDEADARELVATMLREYNVEVIAVGSASEALEALQRLKPDVLVSDIGMPGEDGYTLMRKVRALEAEQGGQIPAVALTAYAREEERRSALAAGFHKHMPKPVNIVELAVIVANLAGGNGEG
jgi:PAS domain S-box-containing protein